MKPTRVLFAVTVVLAVPANAELAVPPQSAATQNAQAYLFHGGAGDVFEISSSMMALQHSQAPGVRAFASMLIADHTNLTNTALSTAKGAGIAAPPPVLSSAQMQMIGQLTSAQPASFDRVYLQQQLTAHRMALGMQQGYAARGDTPALRQAAAAAVPIVQGHIVRIEQMLATTR